MMDVVGQASVAQLRAQCADYVKSHSSDFLPFSTDPKTGELFTEGKIERAAMKGALLYIAGAKFDICLLFSDQFAQYCSDIEITAAWGGQLEVSLLSIKFTLC